MLEQVIWGVTSVWDYWSVQVYQAQGPTEECALISPFHVFLLTMRGVIACEGAGCEVQIPPCRYAPPQRQPVSPPRFRPTRPPYRCCLCGCGTPARVIELRYDIGVYSSHGMGVPLGWYDPHLPQPAVITVALDEQQRPLSIPWVDSCKSQLSRAQWCLYRGQEGCPLAAATPGPLSDKFSRCQGVIGPRAAALLHAPEWSAVWRAPPPAPGSCQAVLGSCSLRLKRLA